MNIFNTYSYIDTWLRGVKDQLTYYAGLITWYFHCPPSSSFLNVCKPDSGRFSAS